jgi:hypothetical protein
LGLPFGIQNIHGQIDNNWMSILGETGLFGLACWLGIFYVLFKSSVYVFEKSNDKFVSNFGAGFAGVCVAMAIVGFFGPYFEFRASMFYFWLLAGIMILFWKSVKQY